MKLFIPEAEAPLEICWDKIGIPHIFAKTVEDAYRGMGYACASERLWQLHLSNLYATGTAASVMGDRFVTQDLMHKVFNVAAFDIPDSPGDYIVDAYLQGINAYVASLDELPAEFVKAGTQPRIYTRHDVASRYRFTGWFQDKTWLEKIYLGKLMAEHGVDWFRNHVLRFSDEDAQCIELLKGPLGDIDLNVAKLLYPQQKGLSGSNNWAVSGGQSASGYPLLATDPHQPHSIPNTFFYAHLSTPDWDAFGASFPGVPYFMMGFNQHVAWGLTTGFVDTYDVFVERNLPATSKSYVIDVAHEGSRSYTISESRHGPILESLTDALGITTPADRKSVTSLDWVMRDLPTSAGILALMPLAKSSAELGNTLFENDVSPLVNNIIVVDRNNHMRRFIATTIRKRPGHGKAGVTGVVPLPGWDSQYYFETSRAHELLVDQNPACGYMFTANNDTMGEAGDYPIHNFPISDARARRIEQLLELKLKRPGAKFTPDDFTAMQLDLVDLRAKDLLPAIVKALDSDSSSKELQLAKTLLSHWDCVADIKSEAACIFYPLLAKGFHVEFMKSVLGDSALFDTMLSVAPGLNRFRIDDFMGEGSPWLDHKSVLEEIIRQEITEIVQHLESQYGDDWNWGKLHQISFGHSLRKYATWNHMSVGSDPIGGSNCTLAMALQKAPLGNAIEQEVIHGPAFRWVVDMGDPKHFRFVIAGGNGGRPDSKYLFDHYQSWLHGKYYELSLVRDELDIDRVDRIEMESSLTSSSRTRSGNHFKN